MTWAPQKRGAFFFGSVRCECWEQEAQRVGFAAYLADNDAGAFKRRARHVPGAPRQGLPVVRSCAAAKKKRRRKYGAARNKGRPYAKWLGADGLLAVISSEEGAESADAKDAGNASGGAEASLFSGLLGCVGINTPRNVWTYLTTD